MKIAMSGNISPVSTRCPSFPRRRESMTSYKAFEFIDLAAKNQTLDSRLRGNDEVVYVTTIVKP
jgi:hypothetical protein